MMLISSKELNILKQSVNKLKGREGIIEVEVRLKGGNVISLLEAVLPKGVKSTNHKVTSFNNSKIRMVTKHNKNHYEVKDKNNVYSSEYPLTISVSSETLINDISKGLLEQSHRDITRWEIPIQNGAYLLHISKVIQTDINTGNVENRNEVELEWNSNNNSQSIDDIDKIFSDLDYWAEKFLKILYNTPVLITKTRTTQLVLDVIKRMEIMIFLSKGHNKHNFTEKDIMQSINLPTEETPSIPDKYFIKPVDLQIIDFIGSKGRPGLTKKTGYSVCHKTDGLRGTVYFATDGIYTFSYGRSFKQLSKVVCKELIGLILEVEYMELDNNEYFITPEQILNDEYPNSYSCYVFDVLTYPNPIKREVEDGVKSSYYIHRMKVAGDLLASIPNPFNIKIKEHKEFKALDEMETLVSTKARLDVLKLPDIYEVNTHLLNTVTPHRKEGLMYTSLVTSPDVFTVDSTKVAPMIYKWKYPEELTIDFLIKKENSKLIPYVIEHGTTNYVPFTPYHPIEGFSNLCIEFGTVGEFKFDHNKKVFRYVRKRGDKVIPNTTITSSNTWHQIINPITEATLMGKSLAVMRGLNNKIKDFHITDAVKRASKAFPEVNIIDGGSALGGDINKFKRAHMNSYRSEHKLMNVLAVEMRDVTELERRIHDALTSGLKIEIYNGDLRSEDMVPISSEYFNGNANVFTNFFALTYCYQSEESINALLDNMVSVSEVGSILKVIAFDAKQFIIDNNMSPGDKYSNSLITIHLKTWNEVFIKFSDAASVKLDGQDEYVVDFDDFILRLQERGYFIELDEYVKPRGLMPNDSIEYASYSRVISAIYSGVSSKDIESKLELVDKKLGLITKVVQGDKAPIKTSGIITPPNKGKISSNKDIIQETPKENKVSPNRYKELKLSKAKGNDILSVGQYKNIKSNIIDLDIVRIGTESDGNCFFSAVLTSMNNGFTKLKAIDRNKAILDLRTRCSSLIFKYKNDLYATEFYSTLRLIKDMSYEEEDNDDQAILSDTDVLSWFKDHVKTNKRYVGEEVYPLISKVLDINLFVFIDGGNRLYTEYNTKSINNYYKAERPSIILIHMSQYSKEDEGYEHYESIGILYSDDDLRLQFEANSEISNTLFSILKSKVSPSK